MTPDTGGPASEKTLLDEFAGQALTGLCSSWYDRHKDDPETQRGHGPALISQSAYTHAEAMLAEKARREGESDSGIRTAQSDDGATVEFAVADSSVGKRMAKLEALNRELAEALKAVVEFDEGIYVPTGSVLHNERSPVLAKAHAALAKAKEVA